MVKNPFITRDGRVINNLSELQFALSEMDEVVFNHHVNEQRNDFSSWLHHINLPELASGMKAIGNKEESVELLRKFSELKKSEKKKSTVNVNVKLGNDTHKIKRKLSKKLCVTGIKELDEILNGGIPKESIVLLSGSAGTGKTTLAMQWLYNGTWIQNESGLYVALTEPITKTIKNVSSYSFYKPSYQGNSVHLTDFRSILRLLNLKEKRITAKDIDKILGSIKDVVKKTKAKRMVIDSITALCYILQDKDLIRDFIFKLGNTLSELDCTIMLTSEVSDGDYSVFGVEEYISDGIIKLQQETKGEFVYRQMQIVKMRGITYNQEPFKFRITKNGIKILLKIKPDLVYSSSSDLAKSGIKGMDSILGGGLYHGSTTLVAGVAGTGKSLLGLQFLSQGLKKGEKCLLVSFEESEEQIYRNAKKIGVDMKKFVGKGLLSLYCKYPDKYLPEEHMQNISKLIESEGIQRCLVDSFSAFHQIFPKELLKDFFKNLNNYLKIQGTTSMFTNVTNMDIDHISEQSYLPTTDNIVLLKFVEIDSTMRLLISILKTRGLQHDNKLREYKITKKGIAILDSFVGVEGLLSGVTSNKVDRRVIAAFEKLAKGD